MSGTRRATGDAAVPGSRHRLVAAASRLFARQGYEATVVKQIAQEGAAPMGSFYFHFPGGKADLGVAALQHGAEGFGAFLHETLARTEPVEDALANLALAVADALERSDWQDGCPVATTALESVTREPGLRGASARAFRDWQDVIGRRLVGAGLSDAAAEALATNALALLEGAELLARVQASRVPLEHAATGLRTLAIAALTENDGGRQ